MSAVVLTLDDIWALLAEMHSTDDEDERDILDAQLESSKAKVQSWVDRGNGVAVYRNYALDSSSSGGHTLFSYGSAAANIPLGEGEDAPPLHCPVNIPTAWAYILQGYTTLGCVDS